MGIYRVTNQINGGPTSGPAINVMYIQPASDVLADVQAAVDEIRDFYTAIVSLFQNIVSIQIGARVLRVDLTPNPIVPVTTRTVSGTAAGVAAPVQLTALVSWRTTVAGRSYRGRTYIGPLALAALNSPSLTAAATTALANGALALLAHNHLLVHSHKLGTNQLVTQSIVNSKLYTQRRRA